MDEIEQKFKDHLIDIDAWQYYEEVDYFLREARKLLPKDIRDILITNYPQDDQTMLEDLWMFFEAIVRKQRILARSY